MASRLDLHEEFCNLLGTRYVYFQPPESLKLHYPCIVYNRSGVDTKNADNKHYKCTNQYSGVIIDPDPDSSIPDRLLDKFSMSSLSASYTSDNLNHTPFSLYY